MSAAAEASAAVEAAFATFASLLERRAEEYAKIAEATRAAYPGVRDAWRADHDKACDYREIAELARQVSTGVLIDALPSPRSEVPARLRDERHASRLEASEPRARETLLPGRRRPGQRK